MRATTKMSNHSHSTEVNPIVREIKKHRRKQKSTSHQTMNDLANESSLSNTNQTSPNASQQQAHDLEIPIKFRLSNGREHRLYCKQSEKFRTIKRRLAMLENGALDSHVQRFFFGGKLLRMLK